VAKPVTGSKAVNMDEFMQIVDLPFSGRRLRGKFEGKKYLTKLWQRKKHRKTKAAAGYRKQDGTAQEYIKETMSIQKIAEQGGAYNRWRQWYRPCR